MVCLVTGAVKDIAGGSVVGVTLVFRRATFTGQDGVAVAPSERVASVIDGQISISLYPGIYTCIVMGVIGGKARSVEVSITVPDENTANLPDLLEQTPALTPSLVAQAIAARDGAVEAAQAIMALGLPSVTVGVTTTGEAGTAADVSNSGSALAAVLNFTIPKGQDGASASVSAFTDPSAFDAYTPGDLEIAVLYGE